MKITLLATLCTAVYCYDDMYDKIKYEMFHNNITLLQKYLDCFLEKAPCVDPESLSVKPHLYEIFNDGCHECTALQKHHGHLFVTSLKDLLPEGYKEFAKKYDKDGKHMALFDKETEKF